MLKTYTHSAKVDLGVTPSFFRAPNTIKDEYPSVPAFKHYDSLAKALLECK